MTVYDLISYFPRTSNGAPDYEAMAKLAKCHERTMRQWITNGFIPRHRQELIQRETNGKLKVD